MSIEVMRYVWKNSKSKANARLMLLAIADIANDNGDAYPGVDTLGNKCNVSHRCAQDVMQDLERLGELLVYENVGTKTKSGWTNLYRVVLVGVDQGLVRNPKGEVATPRPTLDKKRKSFPKDAQTVAPLQDMQLVAPDDMQPSAPDDMQLVAPKSSVYPPEEPKKNTSTLQNFIFEAVAKGAFEVSDLKGLSKRSRSRIGLLAKIAKSLINIRFPELSESDSAILISKYCAAETFKPNLQGETKFELGLSAFLEKNAKHIPNYLASQKFKAEHEANLIQDDGVYVDPEEVKRVIRETAAKISGNTVKAAS